ncbi:uncharacterized protein LOC132197499 isoform X2 [Neocloeon triangulifer]|uniref:uncharacterized protein LOC132197499 isoform X2 n=2 Tax=Neocloeon triangulifer TaxID=2078957 RepID=UPI00286ED04D|nr:uncharacterized protein LOC132197499 isoform X2 [Neocloeon triangulifer]
MEKFKLINTFLTMNLIFLHVGESSAGEVNLLENVSESGLKQAAGDTFVYVDESLKNKAGQQKKKKPAKARRVVGVAVVRENNRGPVNRVVFRRPNSNLQSARNKRLRNGGAKGRARKKKPNKKSTVKVDKIPNAVVDFPTTMGNEFSEPTQPNYNNYDYQYEESNYGEISTRRRRTKWTAWQQTWTSPMTEAPPLSTSSGSIARPTTTPGAFVTVTRPAVEPQPLTLCSNASLNEAVICCNLRIPQIFDYTDFEDCYANSSSPKAEEIDTFMVYQGLDSATKKLNFNLKWFQDMREAMCVTHCMFSDKKFIDQDPTKIEYTEIDTYFEQNLDDSNGTEWLSTLQEAEYTCRDALTQKLAAEMPDFFETDDSTCFTRPYLYVQCIRRELLYNCPQASDKSKTDYCIKMIDNIAECNPF